MGGLPHAKILAAVVLTLLGIFVLRALLHKDRSSASRINLEDFLIDPATERISPARGVLVGSFLLSSWVVAYSMLDGKLTETLFGAYLATYALPAVVKIIKDAPVAQDAK